MSERRIVVAGGGAAGFFAAITSAESLSGARVTVLEKGPQFLAKVRISGGGRCNLTHACFDPVDLAAHYPRGAAALRGAFRAFAPRDTMAWFESRGVRLKTEADGRVFPQSDSSQTIVDCLTQAARQAGVALFTDRGIERATRLPEGGFALELSGGESLACDRLMLATGGCRSAAAGQLAVALGHTLEPPAPSLFAFHVSNGWLRELAGVSLASVEAALPDMGLRERGPLLVTHAGLSGPVILRLSAWGARELHQSNYQARLLINWLPGASVESLAGDLAASRTAHPARKIVNSPLAALPTRLWERLVLAAGVSRDARWAALSRTARHGLIQQLTRTELTVAGKSLNRDEFVTCGGVRLREVDFKTMGSRICPGLYFGGELLDIDGLTGGFNFQAAWTTGWLAGRAMAGPDGH